MGAAVLVSLPGLFDVKYKLYTPQWLKGIFFCRIDKFLLLPQGCRVGGRKYFYNVRIKGKSMGRRSRSLKKYFLRALPI